MNNNSWYEIQSRANPGAGWYPYPSGNRFDSLEAATCYVESSMADWKVEHRIVQFSTRPVAYYPAK